MDGRRWGSGESKSDESDEEFISFLLEWKHVSTPGEKKSSGQGSFVRNEFPEDLPKDAESEFGIGSGEVEAADEAPDFFLLGSARAPPLGATWTRFQVATGAKGVEQERGETLAIGGRGGDGLGRMRDGLASA